MEFLLIIFLLVVGLIVLVKGADWLVEGASALAQRFKVPQIVIGLTVVAFGTSLPEVTVSLSSALRGSVEMSVGNVIGSNIFNILFILGVCALVGTVIVPRETLRKELPILALITALLLIPLNDTWNKGAADVSSRLDGILYLVVFAGFMLYIVWLARKNQTKQEKTTAEKKATKQKLKSVPMILLTIVAGLALLIFGGTLAVENAAALAALLGMSEALIGLTVLAVGTSAPELVTSMVATRKKQTDLAIGNVVGSNIFNILFILGLTSVVTPIPYRQALNMDIIVSLAATMLLMIFASTEKKRNLTPIMGVVFLILYVLYTGFLVWRG